MSMLDSFSVFNFSEGVPYASITNNGVTFNKAVVMKLNYPQHVLLLLDNESSRIAIKVCDESVPNSVPFFRIKKNTRVISVRWNARDLLNTLQQMMDWNLRMNSYRVEGHLIKEEDAMLFDLSTATLL